MAKKKTPARESDSSGSKQSAETRRQQKKPSSPVGAILVLLALALAGYWFYQRSQLRDLRPGEIYVTGTVARGPGANCWILNARTGERFNFFGVELGKLRTVGVTAKVIASPEPDKQSPCRQGRVITIQDYRILKKPNYD